MTDKRVLLLNPDGTAEVNGVRVRVVPVEPTEEMVDASWDRDAYIGGFPKKWSGADSYRAMLSAAALDLSALPRVPKPIAWRCDWHEWRQYHDDDMDPLPSKWDDDAPTVTALVALDAMGVK